MNRNQVFVESHGYGRHCEVESIWQIFQFIMELELIYVADSIVCIVWMKYDF